MEQSSHLAHALHYASIGVPVFPLHYVIPGGTCSCGGSAVNRKCAPGKHPYWELAPRGFKDATVDPDRIRQWFGNEPYNLGIVTGSPSGFFVLDRDDKDGGDSTLKAWESQYGRLPTTVIQHTGNGVHYLFAMPEGVDVRNSQKKLGRGIDIRGTGGYICAAPSIHFNGKHYRWDDGGFMDRNRIATAPNWLLEKFVATGSANSASSVQPLNSDLIVPGGFVLPERVADGEGRESIILSFAGRLRAGGMDQATIEHILLDYNKLRIDPPLDEVSVLDRARRYEQHLIGSVENGAAAQEWPDPGEIANPLPKVKPFSLELLPEALVPYVRDHADLMQCPPDMVAIPLMVTIAAAIGSGIAIAPKARDRSWLVSPVLWGGVVARPGTMKTANINRATQPLTMIEQELEAKYQRQLADFEVQKLRYAALEAQAKKDAKAGKEISLPPKPEDPQRERLIVNDVTFQMTAEIMRYSPRGLLYCRDELVGLLETLRANGQEGARSFLLEGWNGQNPYAVDRIGRGSFVIPRLALWLVGGIQPGKLVPYVRGATNGGEFDDGLLQRFQLIVWPDSPTEWKNVDRPEDLEAASTVVNLFRRLHALDPATIGATIDPNGGRPAHLRFAADAQDLFDGWRDKLEASLLRGDRLPALASHLAKYRSLIPALAMVIHLADGGQGSVSKEATVKAIRWGQYLWSHAQRVYACVTNSGSYAAKALADRITSGDIGDGFSARTIQRHGWQHLGTSDDVAAAVDSLIETGWIRRVQKPATAAGGRPTEIFVINPKVQPQ